MTPWTAAHQTSGPSPPPRVCSNSCPSSQWCHPAISSSVTPFSSCPQSFPASVAKVLELQLQHQSLQWIFSVHFFWNWLVWSPYIPSNSQESSPSTTIQKHPFLGPSLLYGPALTSVHEYWKNHSLDKQTFVGKVMFLLNMLSRFVIDFLPRSKCLLISWLQAPSIVTFRDQKK